MCLADGGWQSLLSKQLELSPHEQALGRLPKEQSQKETASADILSPLASKYSYAQPADATMSGGAC